MRTKHRVYGFAKSMFGYKVIACTEPTTGFWMAYAGPGDKSGVTLKCDVDASYDTKKEALDALLIVLKDCVEFIGPKRNG